MSVFVKAVDAGSFASAANALNISSPMVGRHIRNLEDHLGIQLVARKTRRQSLTDAGRLYYERCKAALAEVEAAETSVLEMRVSPRGRLRVNAPVTFGAHRLAPALPDYLRMHPEVRVELTLHNGIVDLVDDGYDAVIRIGELSDSSLIARRLAPYRLVACASPSYLSKRGTPSKPADLNEHSCLGFRPGAAEELWMFNGARGDNVPARVSGPFSCNSGEALLAVALAGAGIILQPEALVAEHIASRNLVRLLPEFAPKLLPVHILLAPDRYTTPKLRSFVDFVVARFGR